MRNTHVGLFVVKTQTYNACSDKKYIETIITVYMRSIYYAIILRYLK